MPKVATVVPEDKSDRPIVNYIHRAGGRIRLQLAASEDVRDHKGRLVKKGETLYCDFVGGQFRTNLSHYQDGIEESIAFNKGEIEREDTLLDRSREIQMQSVLDQIEENPEMADELRTRMTKLQKKQVRKNSTEEVLEG